MNKNKQKWAVVQGLRGSWTLLILLHDQLLLPVLPGRRLKHATVVAVAGLGRAWGAARIFDPGLTDGSGLQATGRAGSHRRPRRGGFGSLGPVDGSLGLLAAAVGGDGLVGGFIAWLDLALLPARARWLVIVAVIGQVEADGVVLGPQLATGLGGQNLLHVVAGLAAQEGLEVAHGLGLERER